MREATAVAASVATGWRIVVRGGFSSFAMSPSSNPATRTSPGTFIPSFERVWTSCAAVGSLRQTKASGDAFPCMSLAKNAMSDGSRSIKKLFFHLSPASSAACATP